MTRRQSEPSAASAQDSTYPEREVSVADDVYPEADTDPEYPILGGEPPRYGPEAGTEVWVDADATLPNAGVFAGSPGADAPSAGFEEGSVPELTSSAGAEGSGSSPDAALIALHEAVMRRWDMQWPANPPEGWSRDRREAHAAETDQMKARLIRIPAHTPEGLLAKLSLVPENCDFGGLDPAFHEEAALLSVRDDLIRLSIARPAA